MGKRLQPSRKVHGMKKKNQSLGSSAVSEGNSCALTGKPIADETFPHRFAVFSTWDVAHRGLWTTSQWSPMPEREKEYMNSPPPPARQPSNLSHYNFKVLLTFARRSKMEGRREHVNVDTTTCELIISMSPEKSVSKCVIFHKNETIGRISPLRPNMALILLSDRRKGPEGWFPRVSKTRLRAMTAIH